jgi:AcrR family transcriptional regulator
MATVQTPRGSWVEEGLKSLAEGGPDAVRVEALATSLGVSKGGFYWHFKNRQALMDEMLDTWERTAVEDVFELIESEPGDERAKLKRLFELAPSADFTVELALRGWARQDEALAKRLRRIDKRRMEWIHSLFAAFCKDESDAAARSGLAYSLMVGSYYVSTAHKGHSRAEMLQLAAGRLLDDSWEPV